MSSCKLKQNEQYAKILVSSQSGVSNGPIQFESARKILPLLELLAKIR